MEYKPKTTRRECETMKWRAAQCNSQGSLVYRHSCDALALHAALEEIASLKRRLASSVSGDDEYGY